MRNFHQHTHQEKFLTEILRTPIFFSFPFLSNIRGVVLGALSCFRFYAKGAEDPGIQTGQNCYVLLGSSGFLYKSLKTIIRPLVPSRKHSQENARMKKKNIWRYLNQIFLQEVLIKRWERAIYQLGLLFLKPPEHAIEGRRRAPTWRDCCRQVSDTYKSPQVSNPETPYGWEACCIQKTGKTPCKHVLNDVSQSLNHDSFHIMIQSNYVPTTVVEDSQLNEILSWGKYKCLSFGMISSTKIWSCEQGDHQGYIRLTPLLFHFGEVDLLSRTTSNKQQKRFITSNF